MAFLDSLSHWLKWITGGDTSNKEEDSERAIPRRAPKPLSLISEGPAEVTEGVNCLFSVTNRNFVVEILDVHEDQFRVSFPGIDYPIEGMLADLEFHDHSGFSHYQLKVLQGPQKGGDGVWLERPSEARRILHRDSCRVDVDMEVEVKDQVHVNKYPGRLLNLSTSGAMVESIVNINVGGTMEVTLNLPGEPSHTIITQVMYASEPEDTEAGRVFTYGTRFVGYEPGTGRAVTHFIWERMKEIYPVVKS